MTFPQEVYDEINSAVAIKVMGWKRSVNDGDPGNDAWVSVDNPRDPGWKVADWRPAEDINHAFLVVSAVVHSGKYVHDDRRNGMTDCRLLYNPYRCTWECRFSWSSSFAVSASDHFLMFAVCEAAILAVTKDLP